MPWETVVMQALINLGGGGHLSEIYQAVNNLFLLTRKKLPKNWRAITRRTLQENSSDSQSYKSKNDWFQNSQIGSGIWCIRGVEIENSNKNNKKNNRVILQVSRIIRDTNLVRKIKLFHENKCQICNEQLNIDNDGNSYSEGHHIKPLGLPHNGPDIEGNILVVCPNHHVQLDWGAIPIDENTLKKTDRHEINSEYIEYHNKNIYKRKNKKSQHKCRLF